MTQEDELIGLTQAAEEFNISDRTLRKAASEGTLNANKVAGVWLVTRSEVKRYIKDDQKPVGRPPAKQS